MINKSRLVFRVRVRNTVAAVPSRPVSSSYSTARVCVCVCVCVVAAVPYIPRPVSYSYSTARVRVCCSGRPFPIPIPSRLVFFSTAGVCVLSRRPDMVVLLFVS